VRIEIGRFAAVSNVKNLVAISNFNARVAMAAADSQHEQ
jgi:hypothetical protein